MDGRRSRGRKMKGSEGAALRLAGSEPATRSTTAASGNLRSEAEQGSTRPRAVKNPGKASADRSTRAVSVVDGGGDGGSGMDPVVDRERRKKLQEIMAQREAVAAKLAVAQRVAQERKQRLLQQFGQIGGTAPRSPGSGRRSKAMTMRRRAHTDRDSDVWDDANLAPFDQGSIASMPMNQHGPQWSTPYARKTAPPRWEDAEAASRTRPSSSATTIPARFLEEMDSRDSAKETLRGVRAWRQQYIDQGGMNPATFERLAAIEQRCIAVLDAAHDASMPPSTSETRRRAERESAVHAAAAGAQYPGEGQTQQEPPPQREASGEQTPGATAVTTTELAGMLRELRTTERPTMTADMIRLLIQQELTKVNGASFQQQTQRQELEDQFETEEERMEARRLRQLHQQAEILRKEAELKRLQRELEDFEQPHNRTAPPLTPPEQATDVLNPGPYDRRAGFVIYFDFACRLPTWLRRCSLSFRLFSAGKPQSKEQTCLPANSEPMDDGTTGSLLHCVFHNAYFAIRDCPPLPALHLIIELRNRTGTSDEGTLAAWCKLYFFSQRQLVSGRWRLRLLQPPLDEKCFSTDTLVAPSFHGADLCVRLVDGRAKEQHDSLSVEPKRHLYLPNGAIGQDVVYLLQLKAKRAEEKLQRQEQQMVLERKQQQEQKQQHGPANEDKTTGGRGGSGSLSKLVAAKSLAARFRGRDNAGDDKDGSRDAGGIEGIPLRLADVRGLSVASVFDQLKERKLLPLCVNVSAAIGFLQNATDRLHNASLLPTWACIRLSLVLPSKDNMAALTLIRAHSDLFYISPDAVFSADDNVNFIINQRVSIQEFELDETADVSICLEVLAVEARKEESQQGEQQLSSQWKSMLQDELPKPASGDVDEGVVLLWGVTDLAALPVMEPSLCTISLSTPNNSDNSMQASKSEAASVAATSTTDVSPHENADDERRAEENPITATSELLVQIVAQEAQFEGSRANTKAETRHSTRTRGTSNRMGRQRATAAASGGTSGSDRLSASSPEVQLDQALKLIPDGVFLFKKRAPPTEVFQSTSGFDLYIDGARFLPCNTTITKVVGRIFNVGKQVQKKDITTSLDLDSDVYNPKYNLRLEFREPIFTPTSLLVVQVYTIDRYTKELVIIGYAALNLFCVQGTNDAPASDTLGQAVCLNEGGHQIRLHSEPFTGSDPLTVATMAEKPVVPCATLLVRLLPALKDDDGNALSMADIPKAEWQSSGLVVPAPLYRSGAYTSASCAPIEGEPYIYQELVQRESETVRSVCTQIADDKQKKTLSSDKRRHHFIRNRLTRSAGESTSLMDLSYIVPLTAMHGVKLMVEKAVNLPKSKPALAVATLCPPAGIYFQDQVDVNDRSVQWTTSWMVDEPMCSLRCPMWSEIPLLFKDQITSKSVFAIEVYALDHKSQTAAPQAHTYFSCIKEQEFIACGGFRLPLFQGKVNVDVLSSIVDDSSSAPDIGDVLEQAVRKKQLKAVEGGNVVIVTADARLSLDLAFEHEPVDLYPRLMDKKKTLAKSKGIKSVLRGKETLEDLESKAATIMAHTIYGECSTA